jgi:ribulose bisphosphate carboxylase large subunit-like protein
VLVEQDFVRFKVRVAFSTDFCRSFEEGTERLLDEVGPRPGTQPVHARGLPTTALIQCDPEESGPSDRRRGIVEFGVSAHELPEDCGLPLILAFASYVSAYSFIREYQVLDIQLPLSMLTSGMHPGPRSGPAFVKAGGATKLGVIIKPRFTSDLAFLEEFIRDAARSGLDYIIDDDLTVGSHAIPFTARVRRITEILRDTSSQHPRPAFIANITGDSPGALERAAQARDLGADGVMVNSFTMGYDVIGELARDPGFGLGIVSNELGLGILTKGPEFRMSTELMVRLARLAGSDAVYTGPLVGLIDSTRHSASQFRRALTQPFGRGCTRLPAAAVMSGGVGLPELLRNDAVYRAPLFLSIGYQFSEARLAGTPGEVIVDCMRTVWDAVKSGGLDNGRDAVQSLAKRDRHYRACLTAIRAEEAVSR